MPTYRVNNQIRTHEVRLIDEAGRMLGIVPWQEATRLAIEKQLDLVEVNPKTQPPIVRLLDYGKFTYHERKEAQRKEKGRPTKGEIKIIRIGVSTGKHDLETRAKQVEKFFAEGARVGVEMVMRGRQKAHPDFAQKRLTEFLATIKIQFQQEHSIRRTGRGFLVTLSQKKE